ncbi:MAG: branched-chain amino acid aminotransferase [Ignavibacteriales bacterium]|nr:branched-chain amino acid aminotransferase [Ignavibacteriales bacterium]MCF8305238.1 branched-chain amino acid aminotransferase [Ignavibacteriales bacterium]MCF8314849.1 branched-chain amino acid aminotransferase [Ignavibacteriales bacterium]MCF8436202.1 branched-chain amino acid aminotransferase [Ignavibacteriales bacterium]
MISIDYQIVKRESKVELPEKLLFGRMFSDHMFEMDYDEAKGGWYKAAIKKYGPISVNPAAMALHYGQEIFEGLKAYIRDDGRVALFRPKKNMERMNNSAKRLIMPEFDGEFVLNAIKELISIDRDWIPRKPGHALYIRPMMMSTDPYLGVRPSETYKLIVILSPVGPYYPEGFKPVPIMATDKYVRAVRKGVGECKAAGNYAASLAAQKEAREQGFTQVLWLDAIEQKYIEEVGTMNMFVHFKDEVATPALSGSILPGVTRNSVIQILKDWGYNVTERKIAIQEVIEGYKSGRLMELFGSGTAAVISSIGRLKYGDILLQFSEEEAGELGRKLYKEITDIQYGRIEDRFGWITFID